MISRLLMYRQLEAGNGCDTVLTAETSDHSAEDVSEFPEHDLHVEYHMAMGSNRVQYHVGSEPHMTSPSIPRSMATNQVDDILEMGIVSFRVLDGTRGSLSKIFV